MCVADFSCHDIRAASNVLGGKQPGQASLASNQSGATLVEFSLIGFLLLTAIFATVEIGFVYWATEQLENGNSDAARLVRTGTVQNLSFSQAQLKGEVCQRARILPNCMSNLRLDVRSAQNYAAIVPPEPISGIGGLKDDGEFSFAPGGPQDAALVTVFFNWPLGFFGGPYLLRASVPLRNEPY